jgi:2-C-methyl-D-erythritol 4-phosphate cytidylyltransferase
MERSGVGLVVPAAGGGTRLRRGDKAFLELAGAPLVVHTLRRFLSLPEIGPVVVVAPPERLTAMGEIVCPLALPGRISVCPGGPTRRDSVRLGLAALPRVEQVLVHDAARPLVSPELIRRVLTAVAETGAALPGVSPRDAVRRVADGQLAGPLDRRDLILAQTPQGFRLELLEEAHAKALAVGLEADDDAQLVWALGHPVAVVAGEESNLKVTVDSDLWPCEQHLLRLQVVA